MRTSESKIIRFGRAWTFSFEFCRISITLWELLPAGPIRSCHWPSSSGKTALHLATAGGAHGWTKSVERQEKFKDFRAVAFEAAQRFRPPLSLLSPSSFSSTFEDIVTYFNSFNIFPYELWADSFRLPSHRYKAPPERAEFSNVSSVPSLCVAYLPCSSWAYLALSFSIPHA